APEYSHGRRPWYLAQTGMSRVAAAYSFAALRLINWQTVVHGQWPWLSSNAAPRLMTSIIISFHRRRADIRRERGRPSMRRRVSDLPAERGQAARSSRYLLQVSGPWVAAR